MSREQSLRNGAALMVLGALIFFVYAVVFFFRAFASGGFEVGVETLNGVTPQQLDGLNPAIMGWAEPSDARHSTTRALDAATGSWSVIRAARRHRALQTAGPEAQSAGGSVI